MSEIDTELVRQEHRYEHLTWPEINEAIAQEKVVVLRTLVSSPDERSPALTCSMLS